VTLSRTQIVKFVYVGQGGPLSTIPLQRLTEKGLFPEAVIIADKSQSNSRLNLLPVQQPRLAGSLMSTAYDLGLPVIAWQRGCEAEIEAKLSAMSVDLAVMSCFPWRITESLLKIPTLGWWNLHPSLLPAYRGPTPLFWQAKAGEVQTGISLHKVTANLDGGDMIAQQEVSMRGVAAYELEQILAQQGAELIEQGLLSLANDSLQPQPQKEIEASYQGFPSVQDRCIPTTGRASEAHRFIILMNTIYPLWFDLDGRQFIVVESLNADDEAILKNAYHCEEEYLQIQFDIGVLTVKIKS